MKEWEGLLVRNRRGFIYIFWKYSCYSVSLQDICSVPIMTFILKKKKTSIFSWMDLLLETGPVKNQLWEVLLIHLLIKYLSVSYMLAWPMQILFQVRTPSCVLFNSTGKNDVSQLRISLYRQIIFVPKIYFSTLNCLPNFKLLNCLACQAICFTFAFISLLY